MPTIGIDYGATKIYVDKREVSIHIFDTSGSPLFVEVRNEFNTGTSNQTEFGELATGSMAAGALK